ncbi:hypothetical protein [Streptomyces sp. NPDC055105]|uniref:hypothetical protein n=1 Tax=Streptomyces sp. NPDC055105 TaxID=3365719 RepID=UPI0037D0AC72
MPRPASRVGQRRCRRISLDIPVVAWSRLGGLNLDSVKEVAPHATGGIIERSRHWATEERPDFAVDVIR